jgi:hypothetical protein
MLCYRITKYDPAYRDLQGRYLRDEWTSYNDVGKNFVDGILSYGAYVKVENAYLCTIIMFMECNSVYRLRIKNMERHTSVSQLPNNKDLYLKNNMYLDRPDVIKVSRLILREQMWCKLEANNMYIHFGYDYYMYIGTDKPCNSMYEKVLQYGLFVELCPSPYLDSFEHYI